MIFPTRSYELTDINEFIQKALKEKGISFSLTANNNTLKSIIKCTHQVNFKRRNSIGPILGFPNKVLEVDKSNYSFSPIKILKINALRIECNIISGAYINEKAVHTIHEFFPSVPPGYKIIDKPIKIIYLPVIVDEISHIQLKIVDQDGELVNFRGEEILIRLHLKAV